MLLRIGIALVVLGAIAGALTFAFRDNWDDDRTVEYRVTGIDGEAVGGGAVLLVERDGRDGPPGFFPAAPLVVVGGILIAAVALLGPKRGWGGPHHRFEEWHRRAHEDSPTGGTPAS